MSDTAQAPIAGFDEIRALLPQLPEADEAAMRAVDEREGQLTKPPGSLGRLEEMTRWLAGWQGRAAPRLDHPRTVVFAGNHGVAARGVSAFPQEVTHQMVQNFIAGGAAVNQLCGLMDADLRVYELALEEPTGDICSESAMSEEDCAGAMAYGMMAVEEGIDVLCIGEMGIANTTIAAALSAALFGGTGRDWVGPGTGVNDAGIQRKIEAVDLALAHHGASLADPLEALARVGGRELAAMAGAILAARLARTPVLVDGFVASAAAAVVHKLMPGGLDHCQIAHASAEPGHRRLVQALGKRPLLSLDMRLGEASGAVLAIGILKAAIACHSGMATFAEAGVSDKES